MSGRRSFQSKEKKEKERDKVVIEGKERLK
jgi:hypothetical protein